MDDPEQSSDGGDFRMDLESCEIASISPGMESQSSVLERKKLDVFLAPFDSVPTLARYLGRITEVILSFYICTCGRPAGLERVLRAVDGLEWPEREMPSFAVLVVDNLPDGRAWAAVEHLRPTFARRF